MERGYDARHRPVEASSEASTSCHDRTTAVTPHRLTRRDRYRGDWIDRARFGRGGGKQWQRHGIISSGSRARKISDEVLLWTIRGGRSRQVSARPQMRIRFSDGADLEAMIAARPAAGTGITTNPSLMPNPEQGLQSLAPGDSRIPIFDIVECSPRIRRHVTRGARISSWGGNTHVKIP